MKVFVSFFLMITLFLMVSCGEKTQVHNHYNDITEDLREERNISGKGTVRTQPRVLKGDLQFFRSKVEPVNRRSRRYTDIETSYSESSQQNGSIFEKGLRNITVKGPHVDLRPGSHLWDILHNQKDINTLRIEADSIGLLGGLKLPGTRIQLKAKTLKVSRSGFIETTPIAAKQADKTKDGRPGANNSGMEVWVKEFDYEGPKRDIFILRGGKGQDAGRGIPGKHGRRVSTYKGNIIYKCKLVPGNCPPGQGPGVGPQTFLDKERGRQRVPACRPTDHYDCKGQEKWPTDGTDAIPGGKPGRGGNGGVFETNLAELKNYINVQAGERGDNWEAVSGGKAGQPRKAVHIKKGGKRVVHNYHGGKNATPPQYGPEELVGSLGAFRLNQEPQNTKKSLVNGHFIPRIRYIEDLYRGRNFLQVADELNTLIGRLDGLEKTPTYLEEVTSKLSILQSRLISGKDYYGYPQGFVPGFSFKFTFDLYKEEVSRNVNILLFARWLNDINEDYDKKFAALSSLKEELVKKEKGLEREYRKKQDIIPKLESQLNEIKVEQRKFMDELAHLEKKILEQARNDLQPDRFRQFVGTVAALSRVFPAGQPATNAFGQGLESILALTRDDADLRDRIRSVPSFVDSFSSFDLEASSNDWNREWDRFRMREFEDLSWEQALEKLGNLRKFASPFTDELAKQVKKLKQQRVPENELQAKIQEIKQNHPRFQKVAKKLERLIAMKKEVANRALETQETLANLQQQLLKNRNRFAQASIELTSQTKAFSPRFKGMVENMREESLSRLQLYHNFLVKNFEYRFLEPLPSDIINIRGLIEDLETHVTGQRDSDQLFQDNNYLKAIFERVLSSMTKRVVDNFEADYKRKTAVTYLKLNRAEIEALNRGDKIYVNLRERNALQHSERAPRIKNIKLEAFDLNSTNQMSPIDLVIQHRGISVVRKNRQSYIFRHGQKGEWKARSWELRLSAGGRLVSSEDSQQNRMALADILSEDIIVENSSILNLNRPSAEADLRLWLQGISSKEALESAELRVHYTYESQS